MRALIKGVHLSRPCFLCDRKSVRQSMYLKGAKQVCFARQKEQDCTFCKCVCSVDIM